jgi:DNA-binding protein YbaB
MTTHQTDDFEAWMRQANAMQAELIEARSRLFQVEVAGTSGPVTISLGATGELHDVRFDGHHLPDADSLRRDILAAHAQALAAVREAVESTMRPFQTMIDNFESEGR